MRPSTWLALCLGLSVMGASCGEPAVAPEGATTARSDLPWDVSAASPSDVGRVVAGDTAFAIDLLRGSYEGRNLVLSPFSITTALGMLEAGARGETRSEMAAALHETLPDATLHPARGALVAAVDTPPRRLPEGGATPFSLSAVNAVWVQRGYDVRAEYLDLLSRSYDAGTFFLDFAGDPEAGRNAINEWVADKTANRIEDLVPPGVLDTLTRMILTNAVYFKANWLDPFDPADTTGGVFDVVDGSPVSVPFMRAGLTIPFLETPELTLARLPYVGDASMTVVLPRGNMETLLDGLTPESLDTATAGVRLVDLSMPRFEYRSPLLLSSTLRALGMTSAFVPPPGPGTADLTGIVERRELYVQEVVHQGFISVDERGTEAAAATAVVIGATSAPQPATLTLDRPFLFLIRHDPTGEVLFAGILADPSAS